MRHASGVELTFTSWAAAMIVPGLTALALVPIILFRLFPPEITHTPDAASFAGRALEKMGAPSRGEWMMLLVFVVVALLWMTTRWHGINYTVVALMGVCFLIITGVLQWDDVMGDRAAWGWSERCVRRTLFFEKTGRREDEMGRAPLPDPMNARIH